MKFRKTANEVTKYLRTVKKVVSYPQNAQFLVVLKIS